MISKLRVLQRVSSLMVLCKLQFSFLLDRGKYETYVKENLVFTYDNTGSFGELALMYNTPRAATITASTDGLIWALVSLWKSSRRRLSVLHHIWLLTPDDSKWSKLKVQRLLDTRFKPIIFNNTIPLWCTCVNNSLEWPYRSECCEPISLMWHKRTSMTYTYTSN